MITLDTHELAWAAGFFDGEGSTFSSHPTRCVPRMSVGQSDRRPLERFRTAVGGLGTIIDAPHQSASGRRMYSWRVYSWRDCQAVLAMLWRFLSAPKQDQAAEKFARFKNRRLMRPAFGPDGRQSVCKRGHTMADAYIWPSSGRRACKTCRRERRAGKYAPALET